MGIIGGVDGVIKVAAEVSSFFIAVSKILNEKPSDVVSLPPEEFVLLFEAVSLVRGIYETGSGPYSCWIWSACSWPATAVRGLRLPANGSSRGREGSSVRRRMA